MIGKLKALAAGFVLGILVAPRSGRSSRQLLLDRINEFFDLGSRKLEELEYELATRQDDLLEEEKDEDEEPTIAEPLE